MNEHTHESHPANNPKIALIIFGVFVLLTFLYIRFFATYSSSTTGPTPTPLPVNSEGIVISPQELRYSSFVSPDSKFAFDYPVEWILTEPGEAEWKLTNTEASDEARLDLTVSIEEASGSAAPLINCDSSCEEVEINKQKFIRKQQTNDQDIMNSAVATIIENKGYTITATYPNADSELSSEVDRLIDSITVEN